MHLDDGITVTLWGMNIDIFQAHIALELLAACQT